MTTSPSKKILIVLTVLIAGLCAVYYFLFFDIKARNENVSVLAHDTKTEIEKQQYIISLERTIQNANPDIIRINNTIIPQDGDVRFIESLEKMAKDNGLVINIDSLVLDTDPILTDSGVTLLRISAKTSGGWLGTFTFLSELESLPLKIRVDKFGFIGVSDQAKSGAKKATSSTWQSAFEILVLKYK